jgi:exodeoxyribonuclease V gamma subunit
MPLHLTVADHLAPLGDRLAAELAQTPDDPFEAQLVVIPGEGVRSWLVAHLAGRLGIVSNVEFIYPAALVQRALAGQSLTAGWQVEPLAWAILQVLRTPDGGALGRPTELAAARAVADRFDRYALHRPTMIQAWERGHDVDANGVPLAEDQRWQPRLWRLLVEHIGASSNVGPLAEATQLLLDGRLQPELPQRLHVFGITGLPTPHLTLVGALGAQRNVHLLVPAPSLMLWQRAASLAPTLDDQPVARALDPSASLVHHPLARSWSSTPRESLLLLAGAAARAHASVDSLERPEPPSATPTLLATLQADLRHDHPPPSDPDDRLLLATDDRSVVWHRCHGPSRQVDVLRDELLHLLHERDPDGHFRYQPRDIAVLCPDVTAFAPLVHAAFAGHGSPGSGSGTPELPLRVADRSLRQDLPLLDAVGALLELLDGRYRASDVLAFAEHPPVRQRFGFDAAEVELLVDWAQVTNIRWGLDASSHARFDLPADVDAFTWEAGLDQLLLGSALADGPPRLGPGRVVPLAGIEGDQVVTLGKLADLVAVLRRADTRLTVATDPASWLRTLASAAHDLFQVPDSDDWQWDVLRRLLDELVAEASVGDRPVLDAVPADELARLVVGRLNGLPGRARFGTGAITLSSLVALRGVPHRVICLLGVDADLGGGHLPGADDLMVADPLVGDRDPQREVRALLLDAVLAAGERLVVCSSGRDVRTNAEVPPAVPLAELVDHIDATARAAPRADGSTRSASERLTVDHPRQAWSERNFMPHELGRPTPFSFDRGALSAAGVRRQGQRQLGSVVVLPPEPHPEWNIAHLIGALAHPPRSFLRDRLGITIPGDAATIDDLVPLVLDPLTRWQVADGLLDARLAAGDQWDPGRLEAWAMVQARAGRLPPLAFGDRSLAEAVHLVEPLLDAVAAAGVPLHLPATSRNVDLAVRPGSGPAATRRVQGEITGIHGTTLVTVTPSQRSARHLVGSWLRLAALVLQWPDDDWSAVMVTASGSKSAPATWLRLHMAGPTEADDALTTAVDLAERTRRSLVPVMPKTSHALHTEGHRRAEGQWRTHGGTGESADPWVVLALGSLDFDDLLAIEPLDDEDRPEDGWGSAPSRLERWAERWWGTFDRTVVCEGPDESSVEVTDA